MRVIYYLAIKTYHLMVGLVAPFNQKAGFFITGRKGLFRDLQHATGHWQRSVWFHCASLGEFEQGRPLMEAFREKHPEVKILLTFFSPSGYQVRKNYPGADYVTYLPVDTPAHARRFVRIVRPEQVFFIKYEYWYFFLHELRRKKIPIYLVSAIFRKEQAFFKWYGAWLRRMLGYFTEIFVQDEDSRDLLNGYHVYHVSVSGDTRFDRVKKIAQSSPSLPFMETFRGDSMLVVAGSTWPPDEELLIRYFRESGKFFRMVIAPHEVHRQNIQRIASHFEDGETLVWSEASGQDAARARVLIIDSIGMLSSLYGYGQLAYVGGGFGKGIHNILEAATYGIPVIFGPHHEKFKEAMDLKEQGGGFAIRGYKDLKLLMDDFIARPDQMKAAGETARSYVNARAGATHHILSRIAE